MLLWIGTGGCVLLGEVAVKSGMSELEQALEAITGSLSEADRRTLEAIEAFEGKYGRGSFRWDGPSCKELFYSGPIGGFWPEHDELQRIREYLAPSRGAA